VLGFTPTLGQSGVATLGVVESLVIKVDVMKFPQLIITYLQESCMWVEVHNDSKGLVGGMKEVVIFASWALGVILMGSIYAWMIWEQDCHKQHN